MKQFLGWVLVVLILACGCGESEKDKVVKDLKQQREQERADLSKKSDADPFSQKIADDKAAAVKAAQEQKDKQAQEAEKNSVTVPDDLLKKMDYRHWTVVRSAGVGGLILGGDPNDLMPEHSPGMSRKVVAAKLKKIYFFRPPYETVYKIVISDKDNRDFALDVDDNRASSNPIKPAEEDLKYIHLVKEELHPTKDN